MRAERTLTGAHRRAPLVVAQAQGKAIRFQPAGTMEVSPGP